MLIYAVSDTHGDSSSFLKLVNKMKRPQIIFHLGDYVGDAEKIREETQITTYDIRGNNDFNRTDIPLERIIEIEKNRILLVHGHVENVYSGLEKLYFKALSLDVNYIFFGHTHVPIDIEYKGIRFLNPGSPSRPRGIKKDKTFISMNIGEKVDVEFIRI